MPVITLTTDWKNTDYYLGAIKGFLVSHCPQAELVEISHQIETFNFTELALILNATYPHFPEGTIHVIGVNTQEKKDEPAIVCKINNHFFVGVDNGIFSLISGEEPPQQTYRIKDSFLYKKISPSFPVLMRLIPAASALVNKVDPSEFLAPYQTIKQLMPQLPFYEDAMIIGKIIYIDSYNNVITNITREIFERVGKGRSFSIYVQSNRYKITKISTKYNTVAGGELVALFNSAGYLEIAINKGKISELLSLDSRSSTIRINFKE